jgi:hypothetical protein
LHPTPTDPPQRLTDGSTYYWSRIFPTLWTTLVAVLVALIWMDVLGDAPAPDTVKWAATGIWGGLSALFFRLFGGLQDAWLVGDEVVIGHPLRGVRIHLRDVREVKESRLRQVKTVTLELGRPTPLGHSVSFVPRGLKTFMMPYADSPVAADLRTRRTQLLPPT